MNRLTDEEYMNAAIALANAAGEAGDVPVGAVVVDKNGVIVGEGRNTRETEKNPLGHAEINAIAAAAKTLGGWRLFGCKMYVTLEPCPMCAGAIINARLDRVYIGAPDDKNGAVKSKARLFEGGFSHKPKAVFGVLEEECGGILAEFFGKLRMKKYTINFIEVTTESQINRTAAMAEEIWNEWFPPIIGADATDYMVEKFQSAGAIAGQIENEQYSYFILQKSGVDLGYIAIKPDGDRLFISKAYVKREFRGRGYFSQALDFMIEQAKKLQKNAVWLTCNKYSSTCEIYKKCGFEVIGASVKDIGNGFVMDDFFFEIKLGDKPDSEQK
jgi:tRNA(adenine34) deaminase